MNSELADIIKRLQRQRQIIDEALLTLQRIDGDEEPTRGGTRRTRKVAVKATKKAVKKRTLSPEARERIAAAQRKRWAAQAKAVKRTAKKTAA